MEETNKVICKICGNLKERRYVGDYDSGKAKKYVDDKDKLWNGRVCSSCHRTKSRNNMFKLRELRKNVS